MKTGLLLDLVG